MYHTCAALQIDEEYLSVALCDVRLQDVWPRDAILLRAREKSANDSDLQMILDTITDDLDESKCWRYVN